MRSLHLLVLAVVACRSPSSSTPVPGTLHVARAGPDEDRSRLRHAMRAQRDTLRDLEASLGAGQLEESRALAFMIQHSERGSPSTESSRVAASARRLASALTIEQAWFSMPGLVMACAGCHPFPAKGSR